MALTTRQALSRALKETSGVSHFVVKFLEDKAVSLISTKHIVEPPPSTLKVFSECSVKWSDKKTYRATVIAMGKYVLVYIIVCHLYSFPI